MEQQKKEFQYELTKNRLVFQVMQESTATFYPGKQNPLYQDLEEMDQRWKAAAILQRRSTENW